MRFRSYSNWANLRDSLSSKCQPELSARRASQNGFTEEYRPGVVLHGEAATEVYLRLSHGVFHLGRLARGGDQPGKILSDWCQPMEFCPEKGQPGEFWLLEGQPMEFCP